MSYPSPMEDRARSPPWFRPPGGTLHTARCRDALGRWRDGTFGLIDGGTTAVIEMAAAAGLSLLEPAAYDARRAGTEGVGDLTQAALNTGVTRLIVGMGGSATNDGGAGDGPCLRRTLS